MEANPDITLPEEFLKFSGYMDGTIILLKSELILVVQLYDRNRIVFKNPDVIL